MKTLSLNKFIKALSGFIFIGLITSCTKNFKEYNTDPTGITNQQLSVDFQNLGAPMEQAQLNIYIGSPAWAYQLQQNLIADVYSGYMMSPDPFQGNVNNTNYFLIDGWNSYPWDWAYGNVMNNVKNVLTQTTDPKYASYYAWAKIIRVEAMHRVSDIYGPIIYTHYGLVNSDGSVTYDSQKDAYYAFFSDLDSAISTFTQLVQSNALPTFTKYDLSDYAGSFTEWLKFANTLRLRMAMRIVNIDPAKAKLEGEGALANPMGLLTTNTDNLAINIGTNQHPVSLITNDWDDIRLGAPTSSYLNGYSDPRITKYAYPSTDSTLPKYIGIRNGINIPDTRYNVYSKAQVPLPGLAGPGNAPNATSSGKVQLMVAAEAWFLKAEAALRGWTGAGDAATDYTTGIQTSFDQNSLGDATNYMNNATSTEQPYVDSKAVVAGQNNVLSGSPYLSTITIKWNDGDSFDKKLERIITQKWIAMYPEGQEAWSEFRRTGYPKLFPVVINNSGGTISTTAFIRRINFPADERSNNPVGVEGAVKLLGGPDNGGTPLWWDVH